MSDTQPTNPVATIRQVANGYIVTIHAGESQSVYAFEELYSPSKAWARVLYQLTEDIGPIDSRYDAERVYIEVRPWDKYEGGTT